MHRRRRLIPQSGVLDLERGDTLAHEPVLLAQSRVLLLQHCQTFYQGAHLALQRDQSLVLSRQSRLEPAPLLLQATSLVPLLLQEHRKGGRIRRAEGEALIHRAARLPHFPSLTQSDLLRNPFHT